MTREVADKQKQKGKDEKVFVFSAGLINMYNQGFRKELEDLEKPIGRLNPSNIHPANGILLLVNSEGT